MVSAIFVGKFSHYAILSENRLFFPRISHAAQKYEQLQKNTDNDSSLSVFRASGDIFSYFCLILQHFRRIKSYFSVSVLN